MHVETTTISGVLLIQPKVFRDPRGFFTETFQRPRYRDAGLTADFVQDNFSRSAKGTLRGLHYQIQHPQGKLVQVLQGKIFDVVVDLRRPSPTFGRWLGLELSHETCRQVYIPPGCARLLRAQRHCRLHLQVHRLVLSRARTDAALERPRTGHRMAAD